MQEGDEDSLRRALELEPGRADAAVALARLLHERGERDDALAVLANATGSYAAEGLAARIRLEDDPELADAFAALDDGDQERGLQLLIDAIAATDRRGPPRRAAPRGRRACSTRSAPSTRSRASRGASWPPRCTEPMEDRPSRPWLLALVLVLISGGVAVALLTSQLSGTDAANVGDSGEGDPVTIGSGDGKCKPTRSNPGGTNNYIPDAPAAESLGEGFLITGQVRAADDCQPLEDVRIQVWLATKTGGEQDNRASVHTDADGVYRIETDPTVAQFGEPNIHVGYDDGDYREVFIRRVVDLDDKRAIVDLTLRR